MDEMVINAWKLSGVLVSLVAWLYIIQAEKEQDNLEYTVEEVFWIMCIMLPTSAFCAVLGPISILVYGLLGWNYIHANRKRREWDKKFDESVSIRRPWDHEDGML